MNSFTQEQHLMHIRVSVTLSRFHQNPLAIHQFKRYTVRAYFWKKTIKKRSVLPKIKLSSNIDFRAVWRFFQHPAFLSQKPGKVARFHETGILQPLSFFIRQLLKNIFHMSTIEFKLNLARQQFTEARIKVLTY